MASKQYNVININWDTDGDRDAEQYLPTNYTLRVSVHPKASDAEIKEEIASILSDKFGYETDTFHFVEVPVTGK